MRLVNRLEISLALLLACSFFAAKAVSPPVDAVAAASRAMLAMQNGHMAVSSLLKALIERTLSGSWQIRRAL